MPTISFTFDSATATRLSNAGVTKEVVIEMVKNRVKNYEADQVQVTEDAKVETAVQAKNDAIEAAITAAETEVVLT